MGQRNLPLSYLIGGKENNMRKFQLAGKDIVAREFDFNLMCEFEDNGISLQEMGKKTMSLVRSYVASCLYVDSMTAGKLIEQHMIGGGNFDEVMEVMSKQMEESDFFRSLQARTQTENGESKTEEK